MAGPLLEPKVSVFARSKEIGGDYGSEVEIKELNGWQDSDPIIDFGIVKAGDKSKMIALRIWNNKGGSEACATMRNTELFVADKNKTFADKIVVEKWAFAKCTTVEDGQEVNLGGEGVGVKCQLSATNMKGKILPLPPEASGNEEFYKVDAGEIRGDVNDGNHATDKSKICYAEVETYIQITGDFIRTAPASEGIEFLYGLTYYFT